MQGFEYVIVGGGLAASAAVDGIREVDEDGSIAVLTDESEPPYHRPPLSKEYLQTPEAPRDLLYVKPSGWFEDQRGVTLFTRTRADRLDPERLVVTTESGESLEGSRILLATGGRARTLPIQGLGMKGIQTLRTVEDSEKIRSEAPGAHQVALVGAGFVGMELAATLRKLDVDPVVIDVADRVWCTVFPPPVSRFLKRYFEERGVRFLLEREVAALDGGERVERVVLADGDEVPADLVVVGVGIQPNEQIAREAGLAVQDGIIVDSYCETTAGHVYAAGDVARYPDPVFGGLVRTDHWDHARAQGKAAGRNMAGRREPFDHLSYFFTHVFDLSINVFGRTRDAERTIVSGELGSGRSVVYCVSGDRLTGTILINANDAMDECRALVRERLHLDALLERIAPDQSADMLIKGTS